jgi:hypothetical protein
VTKAVSAGGWELCSFKHGKTARKKFTSEVLQSIKHSKGDVTALKDDGGGASGHCSTYFADVPSPQLDLHFLVHKESESGARSSPRSILSDAL